MEVHQALVEHNSDLKADLGEGTPCFCGCKEKPQSSVAA